MTSLDLLLRGGTCLLLFLVAALLLRDFRGLVAARLGAAFALGAAAYAICSSQGLDQQLGWWALPVMGLSTGNNLVLWLFAKAMFDDGFRPRPWHGLMWAAVVAVGLLLGLVLAPAHSPLAWPVGLSLGVEGMVFAVLAAVQALATWREDLVEGRRRFRLFVIAASAGHVILSTISQILGVHRAAPNLVSLVDAFSLAAIAGPVAWSLLQVAGEGAIFPAPALAVVGAEPQGATPARPTAPDPALLVALERAMTYERIYRRDGLTIGDLAQSLGLPEYRLRRLINHALGYRNFSSFLNHYRLAEVTAALADPGQAATPILTIALDAGFSSLGPFNRAFKARFGLTPSAYRRANGGDGGGDGLVDFEIGQPVFEAGANKGPAKAMG
ncbi:MAG: AraC family transcriptional regulator [Caulobacteraceae bacterium]|nr:AraC family transcriptional regulator [Caulobacteraceae bacterium]